MNPRGPLPDTARIRALYSTQTPEGSLIHALTKEIDRLRSGRRRGQRWWDFAVVRGEGVPARLDGYWYDLREMREDLSTIPSPNPKATFHATNRWEQRDDGEVAVVYEWQHEGTF